MPPDPISRIVLTGFMGAGKSTVGGLLAGQLRWPFVDVDQHVAATQSMPVASIFKLRGEQAFRDLEAAAVDEVLQQRDVVIALGGGALEQEATRDKLFSTPATHTVFLETPLDVALARCHGVRMERPVLYNSARPELEARYTRRLAHYRLADQTLSTEGQTPAELTAVLFASLLPRLPHLHR